jgi:hypothetical protein
MQFTEKMWQSFRELREEDKDVSLIELLSQ